MKGTNEEQLSIGCWLLQMFSNQVHDAVNQSHLYNNINFLNILIPIAMRSIVPRIFLTVGSDVLGTGVIVAVFQRRKLL